MEDHKDIDKKLEDLQVLLKEIDEKLPHPLQMLEAYEESFKLGHVLNAWKALGICLMYEIPLPVWLKDYLLSASDRLIAIDNPGKYYSDLIANALGLAGLGKKTSQHHDTLKDIDICALVEERYEKLNGYAAAYRSISKATGIKIRTIKAKHLSLRKKPNYQELLALHKVDKKVTEFCVHK